MTEQISEHCKNEMDMMCDITA